MQQLQPSLNINNEWHIMTKGIYKNRSSQEPLRNTQQETFLARLVIVLNWMFILMNLCKYFSSLDAKNVYIKSKTCVCSPSCSCTVCVQSSQVFWYYGYFSSNDMLIKILWPLLLHFYLWEQCIETVDLLFFLYKCIILCNSL